MNKDEIRGFNPQAPAIAGFFGAITFAAMILLMQFSENIKYSEYLIPLTAIISFFFIIATISSAIDPSFAHLMSSKFKNFVKICFLLGSYIFTFEACAGKYPIGVGDVMVSSDTEVISLIPEKQKGGEIPPSVCKVMHINIKAEDPNSINIFVPHKSPRAQMKQGILVQDVVCKEGLELIKKTRDGSAACVSEYAASKLVERGWGEFL